MGPRAAIFGCSGPVLTAEEARFFAGANPFGFILFARNIETPDQVRRLTADLRACVGRDAPILIDQEGGRVQRLRAPLWRDWLPPLDEVRLAGPSAERAMYLRYRLIGAELRACGIDVNCAPVGDIVCAGTHPFLRNRCYADTADAVARLARAVAQGLLDAGVLPVIKHLPGHGRARADSHLDLPRVDAPLDILRATDFAAFRPLADLPMAMTAHIVYTALDADHPATLSRPGIRVIRDEIGCDGLLMTDDISMGALSGDMGGRVHAALAAGCDLVLHCNGMMDEMKIVLDASDIMSKDALRRGDAALACRRPPVGDVGLCAADYAALAAGYGGADV
ncbi:MAG: glycoside hydrolase family 3 N-terminal domain-containing protein [Qingshengfaniella sp.]